MKATQYNAKNTVKVGKENKRWARRVSHFLSKVAKFLSKEVKWNKLWARRKAEFDKRTSK